MGKLAAQGHQFNIKDSAQNVEKTWGAGQSSSYGGFNEH